MPATQTFDTPMLDLLRQLENALRSGYNLVQAFEIAAKDLPPAISNELKTLLEALRQETPLPVALEQWVARTSIVGVDWLVATLQVQFEVGGNLADKLLLLSQIMTKHRR